MEEPGTSVRLEPDVIEGLARIAKRRHQDPDAIANEELRALIDYEERLADSIARGLADIEAGRVMDTDELRRHLAEQRALKIDPL